MDHGTCHAANDPLRLDRHLAYVSCSIQYPNVYVLDQFCGHRRDGWIVLEISPDLLWDPETLFCEVNASKFNGGNVRGGFEKFDRMFAPRSAVRHHQRSQSHLASAPTDMQAEVLVFDAVRIEYVKAIATHNKEDAHVVAQLVEGKRPTIRAAACPQVFDPAVVKDAIRHGRELPMVPRRSPRSRQ